MPRRLAHGVGGALEPVGALGRLLGGEHLDEAVREQVEPVGLRDVPVERRGVELRQHEDPLEAGVQAVADRDVDQPVLAAERHGRLRSHVGEREEPRAAAAAEDQRQHVVHRAILVCALRSPRERPGRRRSERRVERDVGGVVPICGSCTAGRAACPTGAAARRVVPAIATPRTRRSMTRCAHDSAIVSRAHYSDWHRVERALFAIKLRVSELEAGGWRDTLTFSDDAPAGSAVRLTSRQERERFRRRLVPSGFSRTMGLETSRGRPRGRPVPACRPLTIDS